MGVRKPPRGSLKRKVFDFLLDRRVQHTLLILLIIDVTTVILGSLVEVYWWQSKFEDSQKVVRACLDSAHRRLGGSSGESISCAFLDYYGSHTLHDVELGLIVVSCVILSIFVVEHTLTFWVLGRAYLKDWHHPLDLFIVIVSLGLEIVALVSVTGLSNAAGLVVPLGRVWRFARIIHGTGEVVEEIEEEVIEESRPECSQYGAPAAEKMEDVQAKESATVDM